ncbi:hypothetical protein [Pseudonocardia spirodelae]|uniref:Uncharacterized protein n=1 Tax=Pseudonocardia spirodelae TaxID=3133431 RepID=A0ABU8T749_9PSEU
MDLRRATGYLALALLALYWLWVLSWTAPALRRGCRDRRLRTRLLVLRTAAAGWTALFVGTVHFWATSWWHVVLAVPVALAGAVALQKVHHRLVAPPRHRVALAQRVRRAGHLHVIRPPRRTAPHRHAAHPGALAGTGVLPGAVTGAVAPAAAPLAFPVAGPAPGQVAGPLTPGPLTPGPLAVPPQRTAPTGARSSGSSSSAGSPAGLPTSSP